MFEIIEDKQSIRMKSKTFQALLLLAAHNKVTWAAILAIHAQPYDNNTPTRYIEATSDLYSLIPRNISSRTKFDADGIVSQLWDTEGRDGVPVLVRQSVDGYTYLTPSSFLSLDNMSVVRAHLIKTVYTSSKHVAHVVQVAPHNLQQIYLKNLRDEIEGLIAYRDRIDNFVGQAIIEEGCSVLGLFEARMSFFDEEAVYWGKRLSIRLYELISER